MSGVYMRNRNLSSFEHFNTAVAIRNDVTRLVTSGACTEPPDGGADDEEGEDWCMVCLTDEWVRSEEDQRVALAAHEAVHCALAWAESMGEDTPGDEELAYMVQCCTLAILDGARQEAERGRK